MDKKKIISFLLLLFLVMPPLIVRGGLNEAINYLKQQPPDDWLTMALIAGGQNQVATDHLKTFNGSSATDYAKRILTIKAVGQNPATFSNTDLVAGLKAMANNSQLGDKDLLNDDAWGLMALLNAGVGASDVAVAGAKNYLIQNQNSDGGWSYAVGGESDTNDTAAVVMALSYAGLSSADATITKATNYLKQAQNSDGGWPYAIGGESDTGSTSWVVSALIASSQGGLGTSKASQTASQFLQSQQLSNGSYKWLAGDSSGSPIMTAYAVVALSNKFYPVPALPINQPTNQPPQIAHLSGPLNVTCNQSNVFAAGAQDNQSGDLNFKVNWGDGTADSETSRQASANQIINVDFNHSYLSNGQKTITLTVTDGGGLTDQTTFQATVNGCGGGTNQTVSYRVEGSSGNYCAGQLNATNPLQLIEQVAGNCGLQLDIQTTSLGRYLKGVNSDTAQGTKGWLYLVNYQQPAVAADKYQLNGGDDLIWFYGNFTDAPVRLTTDKTNLTVGQSFVVTAESWQNGSFKPKASVSIKGAGDVVVTTSNGQAVITPTGAGQLNIYGEGAGLIRSVVLPITVSGSATGSINQSVNLEVDITVPEQQVVTPPPNPTLSFTVSSPTMSLGQLSSGQSMSKQITLTNTSATPMHMEASVSGDRVFRDNLFLSDEPWHAWQANLSGNSALGLTAKLVLPNDYQTSAGKKQGQLIFWAIASE